jgi:UDPglucose--hexose-1-phosphate uridylyltransferase
VRELRLDPLSGAWVLIAPGRSERPGFHVSRRRSRPWPVPEWSATCPFCPGNEKRTPPEVARVGGAPRGTDWQVRVFSNRYPLLEGTVPDMDGRGSTATTLLHSRPTGGAHEVVVLSPRHDAALATLSSDQASAALRVLVERMRSHLGGGRRYVQVFVNHDPAAGSSLDHPHAQVVAMDVVPPLVEREADALSGDGCLLCTAVREECRPGAPRAVLSGRVAAWCPFWSSAPYELLVAPRVHRARLEDSEDHLGDLAESLVSLMGRLDGAAGDPAYNLVVHSAPASARDFHWHLHVRPRQSEPGGFELGTGMAVVELAPEDAAAALRQAVAEAGPANV